MITSIRSIQPEIGRWLLVVGPPSIRFMLMQPMIVRLAARQPVRVLDAGSFTPNSLVALDLAKSLRGRPQDMDRVYFAQATTCYQLLALLEHTSSASLPIVLLDLLGVFYDTTVQLCVRKRVLARCLESLSRLEQCTAGVISITPPVGPGKGPSRLFKMVETAFASSCRQQGLIPGPELERLF